jgi:CMP-N-acetylneuraminic acid synthetase
MLHKEIICIIPARKGSKGVPNKNIIKISKKPLIQYSIDTAKKILELSKICISTDSKIIKNITIKNKIKFYGYRPAKLCGDYVQTSEVVRYEVLKFEKIFKKKFDFILLLQPTSPIRNPRILKRAIKFLKKNSKFDSVISVTDVLGNHPLRMKIFKNGRLINYSGKKYEDMRPRQKLPKVYIRSGSFYLIRRNSFMKLNSLVGTNCHGVILEGLEAINIDNKSDVENCRIQIKTL